MFMAGEITQEECITNTYSATNLLWLINQAIAGEILYRLRGARPRAEAG